MKRLFILLLPFWVLSSIFALSVDNFDVKSDGPYTEGNIIIFSPKKTIDNVAGAKLYVNNNKFEKLSYNGKELKFKINSPLNSYLNNFKLVIDFADKTEKTYIYNIYWPYFNGIDVDNLTGGGKFKVYGSFSGSCYLMFGEKKVSMSYDKNLGFYRFTMPKDIDHFISTSYVVCDKLISNPKNVKIFPSPKIYYIVSKNKQKILPNTDVIIKGKDFRIKSNDNVRVYINGKKIDKIDIKDNNTIEFTLPKENLKDVRIKVERNGFVSNEIKITSLKTPYISKVNTVSNSGKNYFRLLGYFPKDLGDLSVYYGSKKLSILNATENYIDVQYPKLKIDNDGKFSCDYYIEGNYFSVKIGSIKSNKYFYYKLGNPYIVSSTIPICLDNNCHMKIYFSYPIKDGQIYLDNKLVDSAFTSSSAMLYIDKLYTKGTLKYIGRDCVVSPLYSFDFTKEYRPIIREITSKRNFSSADRVDIIGEKINFDGTLDNLNPRITFTPNVLEDGKKPIIERYSITAFLKNQLEKGQEVKVSLSNKHGNSNGGHFVIGGQKTYMGNPYIKTISYENGGEGGQKVVIKGLNFSDRCNEDKIKFGNKVIYPDKCEYNELIFTIPSDEQTDNIVVSVKGYDSEKYILNSKIGGSLIGKKQLQIVSNYTQKLIDLRKINNDKFNLKIVNTISDIYIPKLIIKLKTDADVLPLYDFVMKINGDDNKYYYSFEQKKVIKSNYKNKAYVERVSDGYNLVFRNIFIPFNTASNDIEISFKINVLDFLNGDIYSFDFPKQIVYYHNIYSDTFVGIRYELNDNIKLSTYKLISKQSICFDSRADYSNCSLVLIGKQPKIDNTSKSNINKPVNNNTDNKPIATENKAKQSKKSTTLEERKNKIAKNLKLKKMELLNNLIKKYIIKQKRKYWGDNEKIKYVLKMFVAYRKMISSTRDNFTSKREYVDGLFEFAYAYMDFKKYLKNH